MSKRPLVIIPTYNERDNLPVLIGGLLRIPDIRVLVVDDGSPDGTGEIAESVVMPWRLAMRRTRR